MTGQAERPGAVPMAGSDATPADAPGGAPEAAMGADPSTTPTRDDPAGPGPADRPAPAQGGGDSAADATAPDDGAGDDPATREAADGSAQVPAEAAPIPAAATAGPEDGPPPADPALLAEGARIAEALIFASDRPVTPAMLGAVLPPGLAPGAVVAALAASCEGRGVVLAEVAGGWAFRTAPDLAQRLTKVVQAPRRLPRAAMEALSVIAYHQPCTRGEIEEIRGAALAQTTLEALLELGLVAPRGRREVPGRPTLWGTTPKFLEQFGLKALSDLPRKEELVTAETGPALPLGGAAGGMPGEADAASPEAHAMTSEADTAEVGDEARAEARKAPTAEDAGPSARDSLTGAPP
jgi:segregation and condensation protein B